MIIPWIGPELAMCIRAQPLQKSSTEETIKGELKWAIGLFSCSLDSVNMLQAIGGRRLVVQIFRLDLACPWTTAVIPRMPEEIHRLINWNRIKRTCSALLFAEEGYEVLVMCSLWRLRNRYSNPPPTAKYFFLTLWCIFTAHLYHASTFSIFNYIFDDAAYSLI